jgi:tRNA(fMet)-specific endonuclease VapC
MSRFLLDTNILSDAVNVPQGKVARRLADLPQDRLCTSIVVAAELRYGAAKKRSRHLRHSVDEVLSAIEVLALGSPVDEVYASIRAELEANGMPIAANDLLIAAHALALDCILVSGDRAFARVPGLKLENWLD